MAKRTRDPERKRAALQRAAVKLFVDAGYEHVSIANIANEAGIAVGTVYRFYKNKLALLRAMLRDLEAEFVEQMKADWAPRGTFADRVDRICHGMFALAERRSALLKLLSMTTDVVFEDMSLPGDLLQAQIAAIQREGAEAGAFRVGDLRLSAAMAHGLVEGALTHWVRSGAPSREVAAQQLASVMKYGFFVEAEPRRGSRGRRTQG